MPRCASKGGGRSCHEPFSSAERTSRLALCENECKTIICARLFAGRRSNFVTIGTRHVCATRKSESCCAEVFRTTHWSVVLAAGERSSAACEEALARLSGLIGFRFYAFVRRQGHEVHDAQDLNSGISHASCQRISSARWIARRQVPLLSSGIAETFSGQRMDRANTAKRGGKCAFVPGTKRR